MARVFVEFGAYGDIDDFELEEGMTEDDIHNLCWESIKEFASGQWGYRIEDDEEDE